MIYTTRLLFWADAFTVSPGLILVKPGHANSSALIAHEKVHQAQMKRSGTLIFWLKYLSSKAFRQASEVEAYKVQVIHGASAIACAQHLCSDYWLGISHAEALELLAQP